MGFLEEFFINPIIYGIGYNIANTIVYAVILIIALFGVIKLLKKMKIKTNRKLWFDLLPFVLLGGSLRALQDIGFFESLGDLQYLFVTPLIYIFIFLIALASLIISKKWKDITRNFGMILFGISIIFVLLNSKNWFGLGIVLGLTFLVFLITYFYMNFVKSKLLLKPENWMPLFAHTLDACASVTAISIIGGYQEQHVVPGFLFSYLPFWVFIPLKVIVVLLIIYIIEKESKREWNWMLKFAIFVLGMGPGLRNTLTLLIGSSL